MTKIFSALCLGLSLFAAAQSHAAPLPIQKTGIVYCVNGAVNTFNPQLASHGLIVDTLSAQLYDRLLDVDSYNSQLMPAIAERWQVKDNGSTFIFHLRHNVHFQHTPWFTPTRTMNADDVVFSFARMFDRNHPWHQVSGGQYHYFDSLQFADSVQSVTKLSHYVVQIKLSHPDASFLWHIATHYAPILSAEYADKLQRLGTPAVLDNQPVGSGPFQLNEYRAGQFVRLQRHPDYWRGVPRLKQIVIDMGVGGTGRLSKLLTGECDVLAYTPASQLTVLRDDPRLRMVLQPAMNIAYLAFNTAKPPLDNVKVRQALALAINNQRLVASIYYGTAQVATSALPRASWAYQPQKQILEYAPDKARQALKDLHIEHLELKMKVSTSSQPWNPSQMKTAELIQADLARIGVKVVLLPVEGRFQESQLMSMDHDMTLAGWGSDSNDPDSFLRPMLSCAGIASGTNYSHWCDPDFDDTLHLALLSQRLLGRIDFYRQAQQRLAQQLPILPLASSSRIQAYRYDIKGLMLSPFGDNSFAGVYREIQPEAPQ